MKFIDLSHTISHGMPVFPGEDSPTITRDILPDSAGYVTHRLESNMHTGTHIDAPFHIKSDRLTLDQYDIGIFTGSAVLIDVCGLSKVRIQPSWKILFGKYKIVLFYTGYSKQWGSDDYYYNYPEFDSEIAEALVAEGVKIAGFDSPSPDKEPFAFHNIFLKDERFLVENLTNLDKLIGTEAITFMAFPLKIEAEASLIRAVALVQE
jgi:kynurenine formamidase